MDVKALLNDHLQAICPTVHKNRLQAVLDVASGLQKSGNLTLTAMGRGLPGNVALKHKIKKVDRLESNRHLHEELSAFYAGLSDYVFTYVNHEANVPIIVDLCYLKDNRALQMLSAEVAIKGRSIPIYREVFDSGELKGRAQHFLQGLASCLPQDKQVILVMDAGFGENWLAEIESQGWHWLLRIRQGKMIRLTPKSDWISVREAITDIGTKAKSYDEACIMKQHDRRCRIVTKKRTLKQTKAGYRKQPRNYHAGNGDYQRSAREPWILATNLAKSDYSTTQIINLYAKRMQIEESFRDVKSHQFGLAGRYARTSDSSRWSVKMLLAAIVQIIFWVIGVIAHSQNYQKVFQANTVKDKKVFSYFFLGKLIVEHDMLNDLKIDFQKLPDIITTELNRNW